VDPHSCHYAIILIIGAVLSSGLPGSGQAGGQHRAANPPATIGPAAQVYPPSSNYRFPNGQTYVYSVEWHMFNAGIARVTMDSAGTQQRVTAVADSVGVVNLMYTVHDRWESYFDPRTFCSQKIVKHGEEGKRRRDSDVQFDYGRHKLVRTDKDLKTGESKRMESDIPTCVTDVVTGFYYLASQALTLGSSYTFPINDAGKTTDVTAQVDTTEQVKVPAGNYQTVRISAQPISGPLKGKAKVAAWFSNDASHIPVQMRAKLGWGTLLFRLQRVEKK
jgi:Protein of unknown function (DUF3108)